MLGDLCNQESFLSNLNGLLDDEKLTNENDDLLEGNRFKKDYQRHSFTMTKIKAGGDEDALRWYKHRIIFLKRKYKYGKLKVSQNILNFGHQDLTRFYLGQGWAFHTWNIFVVAHLITYLL